LAFSQFFVDKINRIRDSLTTALQASTGSRLFVTRTFVSNELSVLSPVTVGDVRRLLSKMPSKPLPLDAVPIILLKLCADVFVPIIVRLANLSTDGHFPSRYKKAQVMPLLKKSGLDSSLSSNYRLISNLSTISNVLERLVLVQLRPHLLGFANFREYQSGYRTGHSTETA